jgi:hypothetical protein
LQEAFAAAIDQWPREGTPGRPIGWLVQTAKHKAILYRIPESHDLPERRDAVLAPST